MPGSEHAGLFQCETSLSVPGPRTTLARPDSARPVDAFFRLRLAGWLSHGSIPGALSIYRTHVRCRFAGVVIELPEQTFIRPDGHPVSFALMTMHWLRPNTAGRGSNADGRCAWAAPQSKSPPTTTMIVNFCLDFISVPRRLQHQPARLRPQISSGSWHDHRAERLPRRRLSHRCGRAFR